MKIYTETQDGKTASLCQHLQGGIDCSIQRRVWEGSGTVGGHSAGGKDFRMNIGSGPAGQDCLELPESSRGRNGQLSTGRQGEDRASIPAFLGMGQWNCSCFLPHATLRAHLPGQGASTLRTGNLGGGIIWFHSSPPSGPHRMLQSLPNSTGKSVYDLFRFLTQRRRFP